MTFRPLRMPTALQGADGRMTRAGHHFLAQLEELAPAFAALQEQLDALPSGTLGQLAGLDSLDRPHLATGYGSVLIQDVELVASTATADFTSQIPWDDTIPQIGEGTEALSGTYTPLSATGELRVTVDLMAGADNAASRLAVASLYINAGADAAATGAIAIIGSGTGRLAFDYRYSPGATDPILIAVRLGPVTTVGGTITLNGANVGAGSTRLFGGALRSSIRVAEYEAH